jgi:subtilisin family serine protease
VTGARAITDYDPDNNLCTKRSIPNCSPNFVIKLDRTPNDPHFNRLWGLSSSPGVEAKKGWEIKRHSNAVVAVIDTGIDHTHPDLKDNIIGGYNAITDQEGSAASRDDNGHGTHVAGTVCATGNNSTGVSGVAWSCNLLSIKFLSANGSGSTYNAIRGINWAVAQGADILNNSWGGGGFSQPLYNSIKRAAQAGVLFTAAAGNSGVDNDTQPHYPANYDVANVISVASINSSGNLSSFSNYGKASVDMAAPGQDIFSTWPAGQYRSISGTSMATPHVSGAAALLKANGVDSYKEIKRLLEDSSIQLNALSSKVKTEGALNLHWALKGHKPCRKKKLKACRLKCKDNHSCDCKDLRLCKKKCRKRWNCEKK